MSGYHSPPTGFARRVAGGFGRSFFDLRHVGCDFYREVWFENLRQLVSTLTVGPVEVP
jgi:hypothetical protein